MKPWPRIMCHAGHVDPDSLLVNLLRQTFFSGFIVIDWGNPRNVYHNDRANTRASFCESLVSGGTPFPIVIDAKAHAGANDCFNLASGDYASPQSSLKACCTSSDSGRKQV